MSATPGNGVIMPDGSLDPSITVPYEGVMMWTTITPELAELWLAKNLDNRRMRPETIERYARDMENGDWRDRDPIAKISADGHPLDLQHRAMAIATTRIQVRAWVHWYPRGTKPMDLRIDTGLIRSVADIYGISTNLAAAARTLYVVTTADNTASRDQIGQLALRIEPEYAHLPKTSRRGFTMSPVVAAYCFSIWRYEDDADEIVSQYGAVARQEYGVALWPGAASAAKQVMERSQGRYRSVRDVFLRTARGLDAEGRHLSKVSFKDQDIYYADIKPLLRQYLGLDEDGA